MTSGHAKVPTPNTAGVVHPGISRIFFNPVEAAKH
jgi:hypothetical protein